MGILSSSQESKKKRVTQQVSETEVHTIDTSVLDTECDRLSTTTVEGSGEGTTRSEMTLSLWKWPLKFSSGA